MKSDVLCPRQSHKLQGYTAPSLSHKIFFACSGSRFFIGKSKEKNDLKKKKTHTITTTTTQLRTVKVAFYCAAVCSSLAFRRITSGFPILGWAR